jgi:hypothetical protein
MAILEPDRLMENNRAWAARMISEDTDFSRQLERQQTPGANFNVTVSHPGESPMPLGGQSLRGKLSLRDPVSRSPRAVARTSSQPLDDGAGLIPKLTARMVRTPASYGASAEEDRPARSV